MRTTHGCASLPFACVFFLPFPPSTCFVFPRGRTHATALLLSIRFMREEGAGGISQLRHVHDFVASELNRLVPARAGALVLISLAGTLLAIKTRLQLSDGMLPMAELTTAMLAKCPGWGR